LFVRPARCPAAIEASICVESAMRRWIMAGCIFLAAGCTLKTETGYQPRPLGDNSTVQRGYYAAPFSPASRAAEAEREIGFTRERPSDWRSY
jgi:hypothetical protein